MDRVRRLVVVIGLGLGACEGGGGGAAPPASTRVVAPPCSAAAIAVTIADQPGLPAPVAHTRRAIARAATACDYDRLQALASSGGPGFRLGVGSGPAGEVGRIWRQQEDAGDRILATLVQVLELPSARAGTTHVWPSAAGPHPSEHDWAAVERLHTREEISTMRMAAGAYAGYRVGISATGQWLSFVGG